MSPTSSRPNDLFLGEASSIFTWLNPRARFENGAVVSAYSRPPSRLQLLVAKMAMVVAAVAGVAVPVHTDLGRVMEAKEGAPPTPEHGHPPEREHERRRRHHGRHGHGREDHSWHHHPDDTPQVLPEGPAVTDLVHQVPSEQLPFQTPRVFTLGL